MSSFRFFAVVALACVFLVIQTSAEAPAEFDKSQITEDTFASLRRKRDAGQINEADFDKYSEHLRKLMK